MMMSKFMVLLSTTFTMYSLTRSTGVGLHNYSIYRITVLPLYFSLNEIAETFVFPAQVPVY